MEKDNYTKYLINIIIICILLLKPAQAQESIIDTVGITAEQLDSSQLTKYIWYKDSLDRYSEVSFCRMYMDSTVFDSLGRFYVSLPSVLNREVSYSITYMQICNREALDTAVNNIEGVYYQGEYFHEPENDEDTLFNYSSFRFFRSGESSYNGFIKFEEENYDLVDLGGNLQILCKVNADYYNGIATCDDNIEFGDELTISTSCGNKIRILLIYTTNALKNMGFWHGISAEVPEVTAHAWSCISDLNAIISNSGVNVQVELAGIKFLDIGETGNPKFDVETTLPNSSIIAGWRTQYKADIVCQFTGDYNNIKGIAAAIGANSSNAFCIVEPDDAATNMHVFAHEIGHLFGCAHNNANPSNTARGHHFRTGSGFLSLGRKRATVMDISWMDKRISHFSNPNVNFLNVPTGTSDRNCAIDGVLPFSQVIRDFISDQDVTIKFERINCDNYKEFWYAEAKDICLDGVCEPLSFEWYALEIRFVGYQFVGLSYNHLGTGNKFWIYIPYENSKDRIILLRVKDCNGDAVFSKSHLIKGKDINGNCLTYRTATPTGIMIHEKANEVEVIPNPNNGSFIVKSSVPFFAGASVGVYDIFGHELDGQFFTEINEDGEFHVSIKTSMAKGLYLVRIISGHNIITKKVVID